MTELIQNKKTQQMQTQETTAQQKPTKILIVDDFPANISLLTEMLELKGYQILAAGDGDRAIKIATHIIPDLILLDIMMPGMNGYETCQRLKSQQQTRNIPVVFISAKTEMEDMLMGFSVGGADYINKPFYEEEVYARIKSLIHVQQLNKQLSESELELKKLLREHQQQTERLEKIVTHIEDGILEVDANGNIKFVNPAVSKLFDYTLDELVEMNFLKLLAEPFAGEYKKLLANNTFSSDNKSLNKLTGLDKQQVSIMARRKGGFEFPVDFSFMPLPAQNQRYLVFMHDISIHKDKENQLRSLSYVDPLTKLSNRRRFDEFFDKEWRRSIRTQKPLAFIMIDIDNFKLFNDTYGHKAGDDCLVTIAATIKNTIKRPADMVVRLGGEEFAVILPDTTLEGVTQIAEQIRQAVENRKIPHDSTELGFVSLSLGIAVSTDDLCNNAQQLYKNADHALYQAKLAGKNQYMVYESKRGDKSRL